MRFFERVAELENQRVAFALAIVVSRRSPVSSHVGDRALVFADGRMEGFVGGSCSRDIVRRHAVETLGTGEPRLLHIRPEPAARRESDDGAEHVFVPMVCASEGAADVYVEPHLPRRRLVVAGFSPVARALAQAAAALDYEVVRVVDRDEAGDAETRLDAPCVLDDLGGFVAGLSALERGRTAAVVASLGRYDEAALGALVDADLAFVGLVASRKRAAGVLGVLAQEGRSPESLAAVRNPVGLDLGARTPADVAVSILAEIVAAMAVATPAAPAGDAEAAAARTARDPVCGMEVDVATARERLEAGGRTYVFCCAGCRATFAAGLAGSGAPPHTA